MTTDPGSLPLNYEELVLDKMSTINQKAVFAIQNEIKRIEASKDNNIITEESALESKLEVKSEIHSSKQEK